MNDLNDNLRKKLKNYYINRQFNAFEKTIEKLGSIDLLPDFLQSGYAVSKLLNTTSVKTDYLISYSILKNLQKKNPQNLEFLFNLVLASLKTQNFDYTINILLKKYDEKKSDVKILESLGRLYMERADVDKAIKYFEKLVLLNSTEIIDGGRITYLASLNYLPEISQEFYSKGAFELGEIFERVSSFSKFQHISSNDKKIKIAFVSGDLKTHSVGFFLKGLIESINKKEFNISLFSNLEKNQHDAMTSFFKENCHYWHDIKDYSDTKLIELIRSSKIDILIDLSGYTQGNRINIFGARCSPIQILWLGYNNTIGLKNMDYIIADHNLIKENELDLYREKILFLPKIWNAMKIPNELPDVNILPYNNNSKFHFGSFNNFQKLSKETIKVWSQILNKTDALLFLKTSSGYNEEIIENLKLKFKNENVNLDQIIFLKKKKNFVEHLKDYSNIDVALDPFPWTGVTTSFEAHLMGVPVLTLKGFNFNSRCGESINLNLGQEEFIAQTTQDYIDKAILFLSQKSKLLNLRKNLRKKTINSSLFDINGFTEDFSIILKNLINKK